MGTPGRKLVTLTMKERFGLMKLCEAEFAKSGLTVPQFCAVANERLALEGKVNSNHVYNILQELGIPSNRRLVSATDPETVLELVRELEGRVARLEQALQALRIRSSADPKDHFA